MQALITSRQNPLVRKIKAMRDDRDSAFLVLEGPRLIAEAIKSRLVIEVLAATKSQAAEAAAIKAKETVLVSDSVFENLSDVRAPQGLLAVCRRPVWNWEALFARLPALLLILDGIQDPGNLAAIARTAEAAGASGIVTTPGTAHIFTPKALRGAMGSSLRLASLEHQTIDVIVSHIRERSYRLAAAAAPSDEMASAPYVDFNWKSPCALLLGQEGAGYSKEWKPSIDHYLHIPMQRPVESLNVAAAAAVLLYEARRQRSQSDR